MLISYHLEQNLRFVHRRNNPPWRAITETSYHPPPQQTDPSSLGVTLQDGLLYKYNLEKNKRKGKITASLSHQTAPNSTGSLRLE